jgi:hypothetical protein
MGVRAAKANYIQVLTAVAIFNQEFGTEPAVFYVHRDNILNADAFSDFDEEIRPGAGHNIFRHLRYRRKQHRFPLEASGSKDSRNHADNLIQHLTLCNSICDLVLTVGALSCCGAKVLCSQMNFAQHHNLHIYISRCVDITID